MEPILWFVSYLSSELSLPWYTSLQTNQELFLI